MVMPSFDVQYGFGGKDALKNGDLLFLSSDPSSVNLQNPATQKPLRKSDFMCIRSFVSVFPV
jgi:hypothetical protein